MTYMHYLGSNYYGYIERDCDPTVGYSFVITTQTENNRVKYYPNPHKDMDRFKASVLKIVNLVNHEERRKLLFKLDEVITQELANGSQSVSG